MATLKVSLTEELRAFVDTQVEGSYYGSAGEYVAALIRRDLERQRLRVLLVAGGESAAGPLADEAYFASLRRRLVPDADEA